jgi:serine/threonine protein kinase
MTRQIAEALEYAHERGVVHRDLKPANIKITGEDTAKVLDFGLAKALEPSLTSSPSPSGRGWPEGPGEGQNSPTISAAATREGIILGTAAYMSPEQAKGRPVDRRADIWAFGCLLYETLTGEKAFNGETVSARISDLNSILESSDHHFHQYLCGCESDDYAPEVDTLWVKAQTSRFSSPSTPLSRLISKVRASLPMPA